MNAKTFKLLSRTVNSRWRVAKAEQLRIEAAIEPLTILNLSLKRLARCWRDDEPGRYDGHWFFVRRGDAPTRIRRGVITLDPSIRLTKLWIRELIDNAAEAECHVQLGTLADVAMLPCPSCANDALVIGCYKFVQTGLNGDRWTLRVSVLCPACATLTPIAKRTADQPFM